MADKIGGFIINTRYFDLLNYSDKGQEEDQDPEEIIKKISNKLNDLGKE